MADSPERKALREELGNHFVQRRRQPHHEQTRGGWPEGAHRGRMVARIRGTNVVALKLKNKEHLKIN